MNLTLKKVRKWGYSKGIIKPGSKEQALKQLDKMQEEVNELRAEIQEGQRYKAMMELGDCIVVLEMIAANIQTTQEECLKLAWDKIKARKGKTINGQFVKESDL